MKSVKDLPFFAASFNESLNKIYQDEQINVHIAIGTMKKVF